MLGEIIHCRRDFSAFPLTNFLRKSQERFNLLRAWSGLLIPTVLRNVQDMNHLNVPDILHPSFSEQIFVSTRLLSLDVIESVCQILQVHVHWFNGDWSAALNVSNSSVINVYRKSIHSRHITIKGEKPVKIHTCTRYHDLRFLFEIQRGLSALLGKPIWAVDNWRLAHQSQCSGFAI